MRKIQLDSKDGIAAGWAGAGFAGAGNAHNLPERTRQKSSLAAADSDSEGTPRPGLMKSALRFMRNAAVGLLVLSTVPFGAAMWNANHLKARPWTDTRVKIEQVDSWRVLKAPVDASITPSDAGAAFAHVQAPQLGAKVNSFAAAENAAERSESALRTIAPQGMWPWRLHKPTAGMFPVRTGGFEGPSSEDVIYNAARGFSVEELAWLKQLAEAPVWNEFDKVAHAPSVDIVGVQFKAPFTNDAFVPTMSFVKFASVKELAYAGVSRAAYYVAIGQPQQAEAALRSVVSFGFALIDNGTGAMDGLIGRIIVGIGRAGIIQFAAVTHSSMSIGDEPAARIRSTNFGDPRGAQIDEHEYRKSLLRDINDPSMPRTLRFEQLSRLSLNSCSTVSGMVFGPDQATRDAFAKAAPSLVRFPSEQAYLDLTLNQTSHVPDVQLQGFVGKFVVGAAAVASVVTQNPRFEGCARVAVWGN